MTLSPFKTVSLSSLRPGQFSPAAPSNKQSTQSHSLSSKSGRNVTDLAQHGSTTGTGTGIGTQSSPKTGPSRPRTSEQSRQHVVDSPRDAPLRYGPSSTGSAASRSSPKKSQNITAGSSKRRGQQKRGSPSRELHSSKGVRLSSGTNLNQPAASRKRLNPVKSGKDNSFFRLNSEELHVLRRKHRKGPSYTGFSDLAIAQELNRLGRGWEGYDRARREAEDEGRLDDFLRRFQTERRLVSTGLPLPAGAISMQAAADAVNGGSETIPGQTERLPSPDRAKVKGSKELDMHAVGSQLGTATDGGRSLFAPDDRSGKGLYEYTRDRHIPGSTPESRKPDAADLELLPPDSTNKHQPLRSMETLESDYQPRHRGRHKVSKAKAVSLMPPVDRPRPRRVETRPDYRIRRIRERHPDVPPKPPSPSPRDLYDRSQPRFLQFVCEWTGCKAILNNVANLRKHVGIVHGQEARETLCCSWGKCGRDDSTGVLSVFASIEGLEDHLQTLHLESIKWHLGDGRRGQGIISRESPMGDTSYLFWNGRQVTPSIRNQRIETPAEWRARKERLKDILLKSALNAPSDSELMQIDEDGFTKGSVS